MRISPDFRYGSRLQFRRGPYRHHHEVIVKAHPSDQPKVRVSPTAWRRNGQVPGASR
ncbi:unnamed protein product [[Actinomadura] parvosata subsp. kistnae]|nr:unnamed protein product [Actinomadura parvosata subsp. kistnae]